MNLFKRIKLTALHTLIVVLIYVSMIFFMTYNIYIVLSIIIGNGIGYSIFGFNNNKKIRKNSNLGCCHAG